jgi:hypothetical protein
MGQGAKPQSFHISGYCGVSLSAPDGDVLGTSGFRVYTLFKESDDQGSGFEVQGSGLKNMKTMK